MCINTFITRWFPNTHSYQVILAIISNPSVFYLQAKVDAYQCNKPGSTRVIILAKVSLHWKHFWDHKNI